MEWATHRVDAPRGSAKMGRDREEVDRWVADHCTGRVHISGFATFFLVESYDDALLIKMKYG